MRTILPRVYTIILTVIITVFFLAYTGVAYAATGINKQINFQGKVVNSDGTNVPNGSYRFQFRIYTSLSGGSPIWTEDYNNANKVQVTDGVFRVALGSLTALPGNVDFNTDNIYLSVQFHTESSEMDPRIQFAAVPYAFNAKTVGGLTVTDTTGTLTIPDGKTVSFADAFTTSGAFPLELTTTGETNVTLPTSGTLATLAGNEILTNKTIGSTGLTFSGAGTDITTASDEDFTIIPDGSGNVGIGLVAPSFKLHVQDSQPASGSAMIENINTGTDADGLIIKLGFTGAGSTTNYFETYLNGEGNIQGKVQSNGSNGVTFSSTGIDMAEYFAKDDPNAQYASGTIMCQGAQGVKPCVLGGASLIGVVSSSPAFLGGTDGPNKVIVAFTGQVPIIISPTSPVIHSGDVITVSDSPGQGMKAISAGSIIGTALEDWTPQSNKQTIQVFVHIASYDPNLAPSDTGNIQIGGAAAGNTVAVQLSPDGSFTIGNASESAAIRFDAAGNAMFAGTVVADKIRANQIEGLTMLTHQLVADSLSTFTISSYASSSGVINNGSVLGVTDMNTEGNFVASESSEFNGLSTFNSLVTFLTSIIVKGEATIEGALTVLGKVTFKNTVTFNGDTAGIAVIPKGLTSIDVPFDTPFDQPPLVTLTLNLKTATDSAFLGDAVKAATAHVTEKGFTIVLDAPIPQDVQYTWVAISVVNPRRITEAGLGGVSAPAPTPTQPSPTATAGAAPTPPPASGPTLTPTPTVMTPTPPPLSQGISSSPTVTPQPTPAVTPTLTPTPSPTPSSGHTATVLPNDLGYVNVRDAPNSTGNIVGQIPQNITVPYDDVQYGWHHVTYQTLVGWVSGTYVTVNQ